MDRLSAMETFIRVYETGSFSAAARQLHVGQPAVSRTISALEDYLGVRLLSRSTHGLTPTEAGHAFYERARRSVEEAEEADAVARGTAVSLTGRLRVCAAITFARLHIIPRLGEFLTQHPALDVDVVMDDHSIDLVENGIDVALRMGELADSSLTARRIAQCRRRVLGTVGYFARAGEPASPAELAEHEAVILSQRGLDGTWTFKRGEQSATVNPRGRVRFTAGEGVREAVLAGLGLTVGSEWLFAPELRSGAVKPVLQDWTLPSLDLWAVFPAGRQASAKARAFVDFVEGALAEV